MYAKIHWGSIAIFGQNLNGLHYFGFLHFYLQGFWVFFVIPVTPSHPPPPPFASISMANIGHNIDIIKVFFLFNSLVLCPATSLN